MVSESRWVGGLTCRVFNQNNLSKLVGYYGIGHVRYPTAGSPDSKEAQPFYTNFPYDRGVALRVVMESRLLTMVTSSTARS